MGSPTGGAAAATNPFLSSPVQQTNIVDLFGSANQMGDFGNQSAATAAQSKASDDLLQLGNPFADMFGGAAPAPASNGTQAAAASAAGGNNMWMGNGK